MNTQEILQQCTVDGTNIKLPDIQLDRKSYMDIKKALEGIGGKWKGGKTSAFVFAQDPTELLAKIAGGEKINIKKQYQFFSTPNHLARKMVQIADIFPTHNVLEPSAGQGAIVKHINEAGCIPVVYESMPTNVVVMHDLDLEFVFQGDDFLAYDLGHKFDRIIANPPFTKNQYITHIELMVDLLAPAGRLVTLAPPSWLVGQQGKVKAFREKMVSLNCEIYKIPAGVFKESGTMIETVMIIVDLPK